MRAGGGGNKTVLADNQLFDAVGRGHFDDFLNSNVIVNTVGEASSILSFRKDNLEAQGSTPLEGTTYGDIQLLTDSSGTSYIAVITQEGTLSLLDENGSVVKEQNVGNNVLSAPVFWENQLYFVTDTQLIGLRVS